MQEHNFDKILDFLCSGIMSKSERQSVRDELYDHLMCKYETNLAMGMNEEKATEEAINALGNKSELKETLQKVHWYYPAQSLKSAIYILILSLLMPVIAVLLCFSPFLTVYSPFFLIVAVTTQLTATYILRTANEKFNIAFIFSVITTALCILSTAFEPVLQYVETYNNFIISLIVKLGFATVSYICIFSGLKDLISPYSNAKVVSSASRHCFLMYNWLLIACLRADDDLDTLYAAVLFVCVIALACALISEMLKISDILYKSDHEYKVEISVKRRYVIALLVFVLSAVSIGSVDCFISTATPDETPYSVNDCEMPQEEYERICANLVSYGIPETYVKLMPKSELLNYKSSVNKSELTDSARKLCSSKLSMFPTTIDLKSCSGPIVVENYAVGLYETSDDIVVRFIKIFRIPREYENELKKGYIDGVVFDDADIGNAIYGVSDRKENAGDFLLNLHVDGSSVNKRVIQQLYLNSTVYDNIQGFKFKADPGTVIIYATTRLIDDVNSTEAKFGYTYFHQNRPFLFPIRTLESFIEMQEYVSVEKNYYIYISGLSSYDIFNYSNYYTYSNSNTMHRWVMPGYEYNLPAEETEEASSQFLVPLEFR